MNKTPQVDKPIPVTYDLGNLAVADPNPLELGENIEQSLESVTRDNVQLLINQILQLPVKKTAESINSSGTQDSTMVLFRLPDPVWRLPREKPLPKEKPKSKWEAFAEKKGIQKKAKDGKLVYDEEEKRWVPKWGYGGINKKLDDQWLVEMDDKKPSKDGVDLVDPRTLARADRKKLVKKNMLQQKRNAKRAMLK